MTSAGFYNQSGWAISVSTIGIVDNGHEATMFVAAVNDPLEALAAVKKFHHATYDQQVIIAGPLKSATMTALQMAPGQVAVM